MNIIKNFKFTLIIVILILVAVLMPSGGTTTVEIPYADKIVHAGMFAVLTACFYLEYLNSQKKLPNIICVLMGIVGFGGITEVLQSLTPDRTMDIYDLVADTIGALVVIVVIKLWYKKNHS